jgi:hypothetical protein
VTPFSSATNRNPSIAHFYFLSSVTFKFFVWCGLRSSGKAKRRRIKNRTLKTAGMRHPKVKINSKGSAGRRRGYPLNLTKRYGTTSTQTKVCLPAFSS